MRERREVAKEAELEKENERGDDEEEQEENETGAEKHHAARGFELLRLRLLG